LLQSIAIFQTATSQTELVFNQFESYCITNSG